MVWVYLHANFSGWLRKNMCECNRVHNCRSRSFQGHPRSLILVPIESAYIFIMENRANMSISALSKCKRTECPCLTCSNSLIISILSSSGAITYDFLSVINSNLCRISHRFGDTATYWSKIANSYPPHPHSTPSLGVTPFKFRDERDIPRN